MPDASQLPITLAMSVTALVAGTSTAAALLAYSVFASRCQFWSPVIRGLPQRDGVALTFDDGPHPDFTPRILDILAAHHVSATFFVIGRFAQEHPGIIRRIVAEKHTVGNHSLDHDRFGITHRRPYWRHQVAETQRILANITGQPPLLFRPPMGFKTGHIAAAVKEHNLPVIGWSLRSVDTKPVTAERLTRRVLKRVAGHDIILLHDGIEPARPDGATQQSTVEALPGILAGIAAKSLHIVPLIDAILQPAHVSAQSFAGAPS